jgi:hypothetical protein
MRGQYQFVYDDSELQGVAGTLEPWQAYWILARVECTLVLNAAPSRAVQGSLAPSDGVWTLQVEAASARGSGAVWVGVAQGRSVQAMLAPEPPDGELPIQVRVRRVEGVFAADVRPTLTRDARWSLEVVVAPSNQPQPIRLRIHQATHLPRGVNLALVDEQSGARRPLRSAGASLTFTAPPEGGVFCFAIEPIARRTLLRVLNPTVRGGTRAGETLTLGFTLTAEAQVQVQIRTGSRIVRTLSDTRTRSAGLQEFVWDGRDDAEHTSAARRVSCGDYRRQCGWSGRTRRRADYRQEVATMRIRFGLQGWCYALLVVAGASVIACSGGGGGGGGGSGGATA